MIRVFPDHGSLSAAAAGLFADEAQEAVRARGYFAASLSGGRTPRWTYELLGRPPLSGRVPWERVHLFLGDERCVPPEDPLSNLRMIREALLDRVPIPRGNVHPVRTDLPPAEAARDYDAALRSFFQGRAPGMDLVLLGLGLDGHTASLFPGTPAPEERSRWAVDVRPPDRGPARVTITIPAINVARTAVFLVSGAPKAPIVREALGGAAPPGSLPALLVRPLRGEVVWLLDADAASLLPPAAAASAGRPLMRRKGLGTT